MYIFSIIIVNFNTKNLLKNCLSSIFNNYKSSDFEIIVVDNNSQDSSVTMLKNEFADNKIKLITNNRNIGFGAANNQGATMARGEYLFFLNSDTIIKENILIPLRHFLDSYENIGIIAPKLLLEDGSEQQHAYGGFPTLFSVIADKFKKKKIKNSQPFEADWISGAALIIKRDIFNKINGFDEKFFMYFEDIDLCKRVKDLGYKVMVFPKIAVIHLGGKSLNKFSKRKEYYYKSQDYYYKKHYGNLRMNLMKIFRLPYKLLMLRNS